MQEANTNCPTLFFQADDLPKLRKDAEDRKNEMWQRVLRAAEATLDQPLAQPDLTLP